MSFSSILESFAAGCAYTNLGSIFLDYVTGSNAFAALGANGHNLAGVQGSFSLYDTALLTHLAGFHMLGYDVQALNDDFAFFGADSDNLTLVAFIFAGDDHYGIAGLDVHLSHSLAPPD
jgi:hypothetical protein